MSWLSKVFKTKQPAAPTRASDALSTQIEIMSAKIEHLDNLSNAEIKKARRIGNKTVLNRAKATACLKQYKGYQSQIVLISKQCDNLTTQKNSLDMAMLSAANLAAMEEAAKLTKTAIDVDYADDIMSDVAAQIEIVADICSILEKPIDTADDDLEEELDAWLGVEDCTPVMPEVPTFSPRATEATVQLATLNAWMVN